MRPTAHLGTILCTSLLLVATACGTTMGGTKPQGPKNPPPPPSTCGQPVVFVLPLRDDTESQCVYRAEQAFGECLLGVAEILGSTAAAGPPSLSWARTGGTKDAAGLGASGASLNGDTWAVTNVKQFDTSLAGEGDGTYEVTIDKAGNECALFGTVTLSINTDANYN